jgi:hypothetical protein
MQEAQLDDVLAAPEIATAFGEDLTMFLKIFLIDARGINLRHEIAHGLVDHDGFQQWPCALLFLIFLRIAGYRPVPETTIPETDAA